MYKCFHAVLFENFNKNILSNLSFSENNYIVEPLNLLKDSLAKCTLATSCEELTHWKRLWCREGLGAGGEGDDRGWDGWMASPTRWTWAWVNSGRWWWTGRPGVLQFMGSQRVGHNWETELNWTEDNFNLYYFLVHFSRRCSNKHLFFQWHFGALIVGVFSK